MENYCKPYTRTTCDKKKRPPRKCSTSSNQQQQQQQQQRQQQSDTSDDEITDQELFAFFDNKFTLLTVEAFRLNREELMANSKAVTEPIEEKDESKDTQKSDDISQSQQEKDDTQKRNYCNRRDSSADDTKKEEDEIQEKETAQQDLQSQQVSSPKIGEKPPPIFRFQATDTDCVYLEITLCQDEDGTYTWNESAQSCSCEQGVTDESSTKSSTKNSISKSCNLTGM